MAGEIIGRNHLLMTVSAGEAEDERTGTIYQLSTAINNGAPVIYNERTRKYWTIGWKELLEMADASGINAEWENE